MHGNGLWRRYTDSNLVALYTQNGDCDVFANFQGFTDAYKVRPVSLEILQGAILEAFQTRFGESGH
jgi:hypothetical protein